MAAHLNQRLSPRLRGLVDDVAGHRRGCGEQSNARERRGSTPEMDDLGIHIVIAVQR